jgi:hypothetical protein
MEQYLQSVPPEELAVAADARGRPGIRSAAAAHLAEGHVRRRTIAAAHTVAALSSPGSVGLGEEEEKRLEKMG